MERKVACKKCIKAYQLKEELLGKDGERCYWCCSVILDLEKLEKESKKIGKGILKICCKGR